MRFCIDLRKLNARTVKDAYSLPRIEDALDSLNGACIFTSLDLKSGYWQVKLDDHSIPLTAFTVGPLGFYECIRMPFGLTNAPATFQRLMESCLSELHLHWCIIYLDDIIIFSPIRRKSKQSMIGLDPRQLLRYEVLRVSLTITVNSSKGTLRLLDHCTSLSLVKTPNESIKKSIATPGAKLRLRLLRKYVVKLQF